MPYRPRSTNPDVSLLRNILDRIRKLENKKSTTVGDWTLSVDRHTGNLIGIHRPTNTKRTIAELDEPHPTVIPQVTVLGEK